MFSGIASERFLRMTDQEVRWLENVKKAFHESDTLYAGDRPEDCMEPMCRAIDTAKTLRRSLRGDDVSGTKHKDKFIEFLDLEIPAPGSGGLLVHLVDARTGKPSDYSFARLVYAIRCMVHENENLNVAEAADYHILLDWNADPHSPVMGRIFNGRVTCNGHLIWGRLREVLAKFISGIEGMISLAKGESFSMGIDAPIGSIRPKPR